MAPRFKRRPTTKRRFKRRVSGRRTGAMYRVARRVVYNIAETKYKDIGPVTLDLTGNGLWSQQNTAVARDAQNVWARIDLLNSITIGNTADTRIGNKIMVKYIQIFLTIGQGNSADLESGTCRFLLIKDKATTGDLIDVGQSYFMNTGPHLMPDKMSINAAKNYNNMRRYSTLLDRQHSVQMFGDTLGSKAATPCMTFYIPINRVFTYKSGSSSWNDAANMVQETIQFALAADEAGCCNVSAYFRVGYKDA